MTKLAPNAAHGTWSESGYGVRCEILTAIIRPHTPLNINRFRQTANVVSLEHGPEKPTDCAATSFRLSRAAVQKIAAVEGIDLSGDIATELEEFDRLGLTTEQRIAAIKAKYANTVGEAEMAYAPRSSHRKDCG